MWSISDIDDFSTNHFSLGYEVAKTVRGRMYYRPRMDEPWDELRSEQGIQITRPGYCAGRQGWQAGLAG